MDAGDECYWVEIVGGVREEGEGEGRDTNCNYPRVDARVWWWILLCKLVIISKPTNIFLFWVQTLGFSIVVIFFLFLANTRIRIFLSERTCLFISSKSFAFTSSFFCVLHEDLQRAATAQQKASKDQRSLGTVLLSPAVFVFSFDGGWGCWIGLRHGKRGKDGRIWVLVRA